MTASLLKRLEYDNFLVLATTKFIKIAPSLEILTNILANGELVESGGRGGARFINANGHYWIVRDYLRGGLLGRINRNRYFFWTEERVRAFHEAQLLRHLYDLGLPVPKVVAALYQRVFLTYRCTIILERFKDVKPFGACAFELPENRWFKIGQLIRRLHDNKVNHVDLNCFNILIGEEKEFLIDFDKCHFVKKNLINEFFDWKQHNLKRLRRSLLKISNQNDPLSKFEKLWQILLEGYQA
jgi:3-deoxy-D-manno-octulosonic acid kinase